MGNPEVKREIGGVGSRVEPVVRPMGVTDTPRTSGMGGGEGPVVQKPVRSEQSEVRSGAERPARAKTVR